ncbi:MAG: class II fructose-bisphosphate aldolase [Desulfobacteraceae bacterium]|nr:class II fructose-bisphosphate aldolase [Desulfobacteraceae bacterium]
MLVNLNEVLVPARKHRYCVGAFNIFNLETVDAVYRAAVELKTPVIFAFGEKYIEVANIGIIATLVREFAGRTTLPTVLHLDHCKSVDVIYKAVRAGFTSVMFDGSRLPFSENLSRTKQVADFAHSVDVTVEAELGSVPFDHALSEIPEEYLTKVDEAVRFVEETGVDALAVAIGTAHGEYKGRPKIYHDRLKEIAGKVSLPLVLHGGSGVPDEDILQAVRAGIAKINVNTQISSAAVKRLKVLCAKEKPGHLSDLLREAEQAMVEEVKGFMRLFAGTN